jgi:predicted nucleic acid-binding protein
VELLIDSSLWVDYFRARTPDSIRRQVTGWIERPEAVAAIPVIYEIRRRCRRDEREYVDSTLSTVSLLALPGDLWEMAIVLGRACADSGFTAGPLDLLIAAVALHHDVELVTFDADYSLVAQVEPKLRLQLLARAA